MSISVLKVRDPRLDIKADREYVCMMGGSQVTTKSYVCDTVSDSQLIWSITTPSVRIGMDRRVEVDLTFIVRCNTPTNPPNISGQQINAGTRQYPIHSICEVVNCSLNDQAFSYEPAQIIHGLLNYGNDEEDRQLFMGSSPHKPDSYWTYDLDPATVGDGERNPFARYFSSGYEDSRNLQVWAEQNDATSFKLRCVESLMLAPFYWGKEPNHQALFGVQNVDLTLTLSNIKRVLAGVNAGLVGVNGSGAVFTNAIVPPSINDVTVSFENNRALQKIHLTFLTPDPEQQVPRLLNYPYYQVRKFTQDLPTGIVPQEQVQLTFNNITLHEIPKRMYIFARRRPTSDVSVTDSFMNIQSLTVNFDNQDGRLSTLDSFDLWKMSSKNGLKRSYPSWSKYYGSVLCLEFGTDLSLNPLLCAGVRGNFQFSTTINFKDIREGLLAPVNDYRCYVVTVPEGVMTVDDQLISISVGTLTEEIVKLAKFAPSGFRVSVANYSGSGFFSNLWSAVKKGFKEVAPVIRGVSSVVGDVAGLIPHPKAQAVGIGAKAVNKALGGRKTGGARMRSSSLAHRL